jgi:hypothetical protein
MQEEESRKIETGLAPYITENNVLTPTNAALFPF